MDVETIRLDAGYNSVMEAVKEAFYNHYHEFRIEENQGTGYYEVSHNRKDVKISVYDTDEGTEVELSEVPNQLEKKVRSALKSLNGGEDVPYSSRSDRKETKREYERMMEKQKGSGTKSFGENDDAIEVVESFEDGSIKFRPPFTKEQAGYRDHDSGEMGKACGDCAHYIEGGGCHLVQGGIDPDAYCNEFYADVGLFGHAAGGSPLMNLIMWGEQFDVHFDKGDIDDMLSLMESAMRGRVRNDE